MFKKSMATILIICLTNLYSYSGSLYADEITTPNCAYGPEGAELSIL